MSKTKKIISILLVVAMVLGIAPAALGTIASAYVYTRPEASVTGSGFSASTSATEVTRVAYALNSCTYPAAGVAGVIVQATPSGVPSVTSNFATEAYCGETPAAPTVSLTLTGATPAQTPTVQPSANVAGFSALTSPTTTTSGSSTTYTWRVPTDGVASATAGTTIIYTISYVVNGRTYVNYAASHVETINATTAIHKYKIKDNASSDGGTMRHSCLEQLLSRNAYSGMCTGTQNGDKVGFINWTVNKSAGSGTDNANAGFGSENYLSMQSNAVLCDKDNANFSGTKPLSLFKSVYDSTGSSRHISIANDGNRVKTTIYMDKGNPAEDSFADLNFRLYLMKCETSDNAYINLRGIYFMNGAYGFADDAGSFSSTAAAAQITATANTSQMTNLWQQRATNITGNGPGLSSTVQSAEYTIVTEIQSANSNGNTSYMAAGYGVQVYTYNTADLQALVNGIAAGTGSYTTLYLPYYTTSYTNQTVQFNKGTNPQSWYYSSGWATFQTKYQNALTVLATPDTNQTAVNTAAMELISAYTSLAGFNPLVQYTVRYVVTGTNTSIIPPQTGTANAGQTLTCAAATIEGFTIATTGVTSQTMTLSGSNASETMTFEYNRNVYNVTAITNNGNDDINLVGVQYENTISESSIQYGTKEHYHFTGWYTDYQCTNPVNFTGLTMPIGGITIYGGWALDPVAIQYDMGDTGATMADTTYLPGDTTVKPVNPTVSGYLFAGWYTTDTYETLFTWGGTMGYDDVTVYGKFIDVNGRISYVTDGGTPIPDTTGLVAGSVVAEPTTTKPGYGVEGWYYDDAFTQPISWPVTMASATGFIAYVKWTETQQTISFNIGTPSTRFDTVSVPAISGYTGATIAPEDYPASPRKFGYTFTRWAYRGQPYVFNADSVYPAEDMTINAVWTASPYDAVIEVETYKEEYGTVTPMTTAREGDTVLVRMKSTTNFFTGSSLFVFMYDDNFYDFVGSGASAFTLNTENDYISGINANYSAVTNSQNLYWPSSLAPVTDTYSAVQIAIDPTVTSTNYNAEPMADDTWMIEFRLTVNPNADAGSSGTIYMDNAWTRTADNVMGSMFYGWCANNTTPVFDSLNNAVTPDLSMASSTVSLDETTAPISTVVLNSTTGAFPDSTTSKTYTGEPGQPIPGYAAPTKVGNTLSSWVKSDDDTVTWVEGYYAEVSGTYNAQWTVDSYDAVFYTDTTGTTVHQTDSVLFGADITAPATNPTLVGYTFAGWVDADNAAVSFPVTMPADGASFYATWTPSTNTAFTIRASYYDVENEGTYTEENLALTGTTGYTVQIVETLPETPAADTRYVLYSELPGADDGHYVFDPSALGNELTGTIAADGSLVLNVRYTRAVYPFVFNANGGVFAENDSETFALNVPYYTLILDIAPENPTKAGYSFARWTPAIPATARASVARNYTAQWTVNSYDATFNAAGGYFNGDESITSKVVSVAYNANITAPAAPARAGYTFKGWSTDGSTVLASLGTMDSVDGKTFIAVWELTNYTLTYSVDGVTTTTEQYHYNDTVTVAANPSKTGYAFSGWTSSEVTITGAGSTFSMPASAVTISGTFSANNYDATFYAVQGDTTAYQTIPTAYDSVIVPPATDPTRAGYEFAGWALSTNPGTEVENVTMNSTTGLTFYGIWTPSEQTYYVDIYLADTAGVRPTIANETLTFTASTEDRVTYAAPQRTGFTYNAAGSVASETVPATGNLRLSIYYTRNTYDLITNVDGTLTNIPYYYEASVAAPATPSKVGYTFSKWVDGDNATVTFPFNMPAASTTVYAEWTVNTHDAIFYLHAGDAEPYATVEDVAYGTAITPPANPSVTGYTFTGWTPTVGNMVDSDMTFVAVFDANAYDARFYVDGALYRTVSTDYDAQIVAPANPSKTGYTFSNWTPAVGIMNDVNGIDFTAVFTANEYPATFDANGGYFDDDTSVTTKVVPTAFDSVPTAPSVNPKKAGYSFVAWSPALNTMDTVGGETYQATWTPLSNRQYTVNVYIMNTAGNYTDVTPTSNNFYDGTTDAYKALVEGTHYTIPGAGYALDSISELGGTIPATGTEVFDIYIKRNQYTFTTNVDGTTTDTSYYFGATIATPATPIKTGYTFDGWTPTVPSTMPAQAVTVTATWRAALVNYTINIYKMGTDGQYPATPTSTSTPTALTESTVNAPVTADAGFTFDSDRSTESGIVAANGSTTLSVYFSRNQYDFTVDNANGSENIVTTYYYDEDIVTPAEPTRTGYTFNSWSPAVPAKMPAAATTVTAQWDINSYSVRFYNNFVSATTPVSTSTVNYNAPINAFTDQEQTGYTFLGWAYADDDSETILSFPLTMGTEDVDLVAVWQIHTFTVTYRSMGAVYQAYNDVAFGTSPMPQPADPTRTGYTFGGWSPVIPASMPDANQNFVAIWNINSYDVIYKVDDEDYQTDSYNYGSSITPLDEPTREGYTFSGWSAIPDTMPANDVTVTGTFTANDYTVSYAYTGAVPAGAAAVPAETTTNHINDTVNVAAAPTLAGYTFSGWATADATVSGGSFTMPAADVAFTGSWTANEQTYYVEVYKMLTDGTYSSAPNEVLNFTADTAETVSYTMVAPTGFTVDAANSTVSGTIPATGNLTLVAKYSRNQYTFTTDDDFGTVNNSTIYYDAAIPTPATPVQAGYAFNSWSPEIPAKMPASGVSVTATWDYVDYTVTYIYSNTPAYGTAPAVPAATTANHIGDAKTVAAAPELIGYTFSGWTTTDVTVSDNAYTMPAGDVTFTGTWTPIDYAVSYSYSGEVPAGAPAAPASVNKNIGNDVDVEAAPELTGYTFSGWTTMNATVEDGSFTMPANAVVFTGNWITNNYNVTFMSDGSAFYGPTSTPYGSAISQPSTTPVKNGYTFAGWDAEIPATMPANDLTFNATWTANEQTYYVAIYKMRTDGTYPATPTEILNFTANTAEEVTYTMTADTGFTVDAANSTVTGTIPAVGNLTLVAKYSRNQYTFTVNVDGNTTDRTYYYGANIVPVDDGVKTGYTFTGWLPEIPATMPADDLTVVAQFSINSYTATFLDFDGNVYDTTTVVYNTAVILPAGTPTKEFYTFEGWVDVPATMPADDITITPNFARVPVTLTLVAESTAVIDTEDATEDISGYIYGLARRLTSTRLLNEYLEVEGDGRLLVTPTMYGLCGTGTRVDVIDNTNDTVVETYYIVIYGDINGDSDVDQSDTSALNAEIMGATDWSNSNSANYSMYRVLAGDLNANDGRITTQDKTVVRDIVRFAASVDQTTGIVTYNS